MAIKALLFDVDGVLLDSSATHRRIWNAWSQMRGLDGERVWSLTHGRRPEDTVLDVAPDLDPVAERKVLNDLMVREGDSFPAARGAAALLGGLERHPWALVTSGSRGPVHRRFKLASLPLPSVQIYGEDVRRSKPHPEGYLRAAELLATDPADCVVIEDTPHGITAGRAAGCAVIAVATTHAPDALVEADACFSSLEEATPCLLTMIGDPSASR
ncbi:HAD-IA family hydrolase [Streptosporangium carneum]|uniref:Haloacid dehalogenase n=1 Tax=Streptosporangium carneum TaxID=47481 RepID=A0A9W6I7X8_9ACTN|nr:HAD-IA family hydrolase [Streptosporangium carneum]GLK13742.1 haloacid dehalogenase [Streptosporangium carneum]